MRLSTIAALLHAEVLTCADLLERDVQSACGSDFMSDVLAYVKNQSVLLTGRTNAQVIRTAEMMDILCVIYVRGKRPDEASLQLAQERNMVIMSSRYRMYEACGKLYSAGLHDENEDDQP